jgi:hypothetical protein
LLIGRCCNPLGAGAFLADLKSEIIQIQKDFLNKQEMNRPRIPRGPRLNAQERWNGKVAATKRVNVRFVEQCTFTYKRLE